MNRDLFGETDLQRLLRERLLDLQREWDGLAAEMEGVRARSESLARHLSIMQQAYNAEVRGREAPEEQPAVNGRGHPLVGLKLRDAVAVLRDENPGITKQGVRERLEQANFDFNGKRHGNAVHMAWVGVDALARE